MLGDRDRAAAHHLLSQYSNQQLRERIADSEAELAALLPKVANLRAGIEAAKAVLEDRTYARLNQPCLVRVSGGTERAEPSRVNLDADGRPICYEGTYSDAGHCLLKSFGPPYDGRCRVWEHSEGHTVYVPVRTTH